MSMSQNSLQTYRVIAGRTSAQTYSFIISLLATQNKVQTPQTPGFKYLLESTQATYKSEPTINISPLRAVFTPSRTQSSNQTLLSKSTNPDLNPPSPTIDPAHPLTTCYPEHTSHKQNTPHACTHYTADPTNATGTDGTYGIARPLAPVLALAVGC